MTNEAKRGNTVAGPTKTVAVTNTRYPTPPPGLAALACLFGHTFRVVLKGKSPIALECANCPATWKTERVGNGGQEG